MTAIIPLILQGLTILPGIFASFKTIFGTSTATPAQKSAALTDVAGTVLKAVGSVSAGGQKDTMDKAISVLPMFQSLTENLMALAESSGKPGADKQAYVSGIMTAALQGAETLFTGGAAATVAEIEPIVKASIDTLVPVLFPKDSASDGLGTQSAG